MGVDRLPCPAWCMAGSRHDFEPGPDGVSRRHHHPIRWLQWSRSDGSMPAVAVGLAQEEQATSDQGPARRGPMEIVLAGGLDREVTGPLARQLAAALTDAAELWEAAHRPIAVAPAA